MPKYTHSVSWSRQIESDYEDFDDVLRHEPELVAEYFSDLQELQLECFETSESLPSCVICEEEKSEQDISLESDDTVCIDCDEEVK